MKTNIRLYFVYIALNSHCCKQLVLSLFSCGKCLFFQHVMSCKQSNKLDTKIGIIINRKIKLSST